MAKYVDGYVLVVPKKKVAEYKKMARIGARVWKKYGALEYMECMGEDLKPKMAGAPAFMNFPKMAKAKPNETVWFSFIVFKSKKHRDQVNAKVMKAMEKEMAQFKDTPMPFDMKRMAYGGFSVIVEA
jgi:uncharacterized protein YbaA (DUF1428 family)